MDCTTQISDLALLRLLQLASPALPVGAYSYSQGLEWAIEDGTVFDQVSATRWIQDTLRYSAGRFEAPVWWRLYQAWAQDDLKGVARWNALLCAARETAELRAETLQMGFSLMRLLAELKAIGPERLALLQELRSVTFATAFSCAAAEWNIPPRAALLAYLWLGAENQVLAALKAVPLGQVAG